MATTTSITTTYAGEFAGKYIAAALLSAPTLDKGLVTIKPNIKYKEVMKRYANNDIIKDATCDFSSTSTVTLTERILQPEEFQVNLELCKKDFRSDWEAVEMGISVYDNLPPTFADFMVANVAGQVAQAIEKNIWSGSNALAGQFAGFEQLFQTAGSGVLSGSFGGATTGSTTVISAFEDALALVPDTVYGKEDLVIYASTATVKAYQQALSDKNWMFKSYDGAKPLDFVGTSIVHCPGLPKGKIALAQKSNLFFGTGLLSDKNEVKLLDMADLDGSQNVRVIMRYTAGVQFGIGSEIVWGI
jgi:hypothetical protein